jgi:hypothetical protein
MTKYIQLLMLAAVSIVLHGCGPTYGCALKNEDGYCASMERTFKESRTDGGDSESVFTNPEEDDGSDDDEKMDNFAFNQSELGHGKPPTWGSPVYDPGKPWRIFIMPWTDDHGILHGGEYIYIATKPKWNYGTLRDAGSASGLLGPLSNNVPKGSYIPDNPKTVSGKLAPDFNLSGKP